MMHWISGLPIRIAGLSRWRRIVLLFVMGAVTTLAFAPFHQPWVLWPGFAVLIWSMAAATGWRQAFGAGFWFGYGQFLGGLYWITSAFLVDAAAFGWLVPLPLFGLPALLALFPATAVLISWRLARGNIMMLVLLLAATWTMAEMARGHLFTGFPWNLMGYATGVHVAAMQPVVWIGIFGLGFLVVLAGASAALLAYVGDDRIGRGSARRVPVPALAVALVLALGIPTVIFSVGMARLKPVQFADDAPTIRVVQANIAQADKWQSDTRDANFQEQLRMSRATIDGASARPDVVIWPETAATYYLSHDELKRQQLAALAADLSPDGVVITGALHAEEQPGQRPSIYNVGYGITGRAGDRPTVYAKKHLVPFGEYLPFRSVLSRIGLRAIAEARGDFSAGPEPVLFAVPGLPAARMLICYEAIFPAEVPVSAGAARPAWLINLTNDAWFGGLTGPYQHFDMARFRAVEQGAPLVRAAGTGISGLVDPYGRIVALIGLNDKGVVDFRLPERIPDAGLSGLAEPFLLLFLAAFVLMTTAIARLSRIIGQ